MDKWVKIISQTGSIHATAVTARDLVEDARNRHRISKAETIGLGEALIGGLLLASRCKKGENVSLSIKGDRFFRNCIVDADPVGTVRGFIVAKELTQDIDPDRGPWQNGFLSVIRQKLDDKEPYVGTVPIVTGHLPKDLTYYLSQSEQIPSSVGIAVNIAADKTVAQAGGFLVQVMPGASSKEIQDVETHINQLQSLAAKLRGNADPTLLLAQIFSEAGFTILEDRPLAFACNCSKGRVLRAIKLVGSIEIKSMLAEDKGAQINCDFCGKHYSITAIELQELLQEIEGKN